MEINCMIQKQIVIAQSRLVRANRLDMGREATALPVQRRCNRARIEADLVGKSTMSRLIALLST